MDIAKNFGATDRFLRTLAGASSISYAMNGHPEGWLGLLLLLSAIVEFCPIYHYFGIDTRGPHDRSPFR